MTQALEGFGLTMKNRITHLRILTDNTTAIAVVNHMGTSHSDPCNRLGKEIWEWCIEHKIWLSAAHIPRVHNIKTDFESRRTNDNTEWMLDRASLNNASLRPTIDLFASQINNHFPQYVSFKPDPGAVAVDDFSPNLCDLTFYAFPPFSVINTFLQRVQDDQASGILVIPNWPTQAWFPQGMQMCLEPPITLHQAKHLLQLPGKPKKLHPLHKTLTLLVCHLSGSNNKKKGLSPDTIDIFMDSWRKSTGKQYTTYLSRWVTYCKNKQLDVTHATVNDGLDFLTLLYKQGVGYSAINTAQSALSSVITPADKTTFGEHPLVSCFLNGTFELRPFFPRYSNIWDVGIVLTYLQSFPVLNDLILKQLTLNRTMLLALATAQRTQTLSKLDTSCMQETTTGIIFTIRDTLKTT